MLGVLLHTLIYLYTTIQPNIAIYGHTSFPKVHFTRHLL